MNMMFLWYLLLSVTPLVIADEGVSLRISALSTASYASQRQSIHCVNWVEDFVLCPLTVSGNKIGFSNFSTISDDVLEYKLRSDTSQYVVSGGIRKTAVKARKAIIGLRVRWMALMPQVGSIRKN